MSLADHPSFDRLDEAMDGLQPPLPPSREHMALSAEKRRAALLLLHRHLTEFPDNPTGWRRTINLSYVEACEVLSAYVQTAETADLRKSALALLQSMDISMPTLPQKAAPGLHAPSLPAPARLRRRLLPEDIQFGIYASMRFLLDKMSIPRDLAYRLARCIPPQWGKYEGKFQCGTGTEIDPAVYEEGQEHLARTIGWTVETTREQLIELASSLEPTMKKPEHVPGKPTKKELHELAMERKRIMFVAVYLLCEACGWSEEQACAVFDMLPSQHYRNGQAFSGVERDKQYRTEAAVKLKETILPQEWAGIEERLRRYEEMLMKLSFDPTDAPAGSRAKMDVLAERIRFGMPLWHPEDREDMEGMIAPIPPQPESVGNRNDRGDSPIGEEPEERDV